MREDFVTRLQTQLHDAAEREARRGRLGRAVRDAEWRLPAPELAAALAVAVFGVAIVAGVFALGSKEPPPTGPAVVAEVELTGNPEGILPAFGSLWIADPLAGLVLRVDADVRRVVARIPVGSAGYLAMTPVGDELWVSDTRDPRLLRIDPATNAVRGRIPLRTPDGGAFVALEVLASDRAVWAVSEQGALRLDPQTGTAVRLAATPTDQGEAAGFALGDDALWMLHTDGSIRRLDPLTGAETDRIRPGLADVGVIGDVGGDLLVGTGTAVARLDRGSGQVIWQQAIGDQANAVDGADGLVWIHSTTARERDRLTAFALDDGERVASTALDTFGSTDIAALGREVWVNTAGGETVVVRR